MKDRSRFDKAAGFVIGFVTVAWLAALSRQPAAALGVLPESEGSLKTVEIQFTREAAPLTWPSLNAFLRQIDPAVEVIVACASVEDASEFVRLARRPFRKLIVGKPITGWSKDRFLVAGAEPAVLLAPKRLPAAHEARSHDALVPARLAKQWPDRFSFKESRLNFEAGDILCTRTRAIYCEELEKKNPGVSRLADEIEALTGKRPLKLVDAPAHHIGMFAAPLDERTVAVGDPDLGKRLWTEEASRALGSPNWAEAETGPFRKAASALAKAGFRVVRLPTAVIGPKVYVSYTNAVFETREGRKIVYMPVYGIAELDSVARMAYESEGWEVRPVPVDKVFRFCGTIGCLVNVLERG